MIAKTAIIYPHVKIGKNPQIEDYCIVGSPLQDGSFPETIIGDNCVLRSHTVVYSGNQIGDNFKTGNKVNIRELNRVGNNVSIGTLSVVEHHVTIEENVRIHTSAFVPEFSILKKGCWIGPHVVLTNAKYPNQPNTKNELAGVVVEAGAIIGANSTISPGVQLGAGSLVGSGANVVRNLESNKVAVGNPAKERDIKKI
jgi:acetyltransferase-like isoleucine patch superfamily enzyme